ncbi:ABC transporter substrate-binding protein [Synechococcus sp. W2B2]|uniref:ABC transporter substrate-binding protein n=1 Tax=unclassified Synechococcus TaxID=2626047 RepID=UPI00006B0C5C|nr:ABC transporter, likely sugar solute binding protein [Synechococcus sp. WH 7805]
MFSRRKFSSLLIGLFCLVALISTTPALVASQVETISILMPAPFADSTVKLVENFNTLYKNQIHLNVIRGPRQTESMSDLAISSLLLGDTPFDGLLMDITWLPKYARAGWLEGLDPYFDETDIADLASGAEKGNDFEGTLYRWPLVADMGLLFWRTDLMNTPPKTPSELVSISNQLQTQGKVPWGYVWQGRQYEGLSCVYLEMIDGFGGDWFDVNNQSLGLNEVPGVEAAQWLTDLIETGISPRAVTTFAEPEALRNFQSGESAFMRNWPYAWAELQKQDSPVRGKIGISTMVSLPGVEPASTLGSWGFTLLRGSNHKDAVIKAIKYLTSAEAQRVMFIEHGYTPTVKALYEDLELIQDYPHLALLSRALNNAVLRPETPIYAQISDVLQRSLSASLTGEEKPKLSMNRADRSSEQILVAAGGTPS